MGKFASGDPTGCSDNLSPDLGDRKESRRTIKVATERATEERSRRRCPRPWTEVILKLISSKNTLLNGLADSLGMEKLEL